MLTLTKEDTNYPSPEAKDETIKKQKFLLDQYDGMEGGQIDPIHIYKENMELEG